jgi:hypothetical protein
MPGGSVDDVTIRSLFRIGLHLQQAVPAGDRCVDQHLRAAVDELDRLVRTIRDAAFTADGEPAPVAGDGRLHHLPPIELAPLPHAARSELCRLLETVAALHARLHRVIVALTLSEEAAADLLDRLADDPARTHEMRAHARRGHAVADTCRAFALRLAALRPEAAVDHARR